MISRNSVIAVCTPFTSVCRSWLMSLIITFMFEPAKLQMNCARASGAMNARAEPTQLAVANPCPGGVVLTPTASAAAGVMASPVRDERRRC